MSGQRTGSLSSLRELNRLKVLEIVRERGAVSRADIATATGLARSTVSMLVSEMLRAGIAVERESEKDQGTGGAGRPPTLVSLDPGAAAVIGIHFAHDSVRVAIADLGLTLLGEDAVEADAFRAYPSVRAPLRRSAKSSRRRRFPSSRSRTGPSRASTRS